ncbi:MAG: hypothetical protein WA691_06020 [Thermoplasmata archaeon]
MAVPLSPEVEARFAQLEKEIRGLYVRVVALERMVGAGGLHDYDQATVQKKAAFDWQAPDRT